MSSVGDNMSDKKFFDKTIPSSCGYCLNGQVLGNGKEVFCMKKGIMSANDSCSSYDYDALKRIPKIRVVAGDYKDEDFKL